MMIITYTHTSIHTYIHTYDMWLRYNTPKTKPDNDAENRDQNHFDIDDDDADGDDANIADDSIHWWCF